MVSALAAVRLAVDDGGGEPERLTATSGVGIPGIRERIAGLGGTLPIGPSEGGVGISAIMPADRRTRREPEGGVLGREWVGRGMSPERPIM